MSKEPSSELREPSLGALGSAGLSPDESLLPAEIATCDVCDALLPTDAGDDDSDGGRGLYVWVRHGVVVYEEPPLCAACAAAITMTAFQRWSVEEDEG
jgi:hypothetical protein